MRKTIPFVKMHGLGNDFVITSDNHVQSITDKSELAIKLSDRRLGIGCDQFITYSEYNDYIKMSIYNQDGSKARACGNASRCLSKLIFEQNGKRNITLKIEDREIKCSYTSPDEIKVDMGQVSFNETWMPNTSNLWDLAQRYRIEPKEMMCADVSNPHLVIFSELSNQDKKIIGKNFQTIDLFPEGINVNFAQIKDDKIYLKVWERGTGFTYACGSGAVATFAAAHKLGFSGDKVEIIFKLGSLRMEKLGNNIHMTGPANYVFHGEYIYE